MKKIISLILLITINFYYSQSVHEGINYQLSTTGTRGEYLKYSEIQGSPYLNKDFAIAKAACCKEVLPMRYDMYADQIEYQKGGMVYILSKQEPYTKIIFKDSNTTLALENVDKKNSDLKYFVILIDGENSLLKKVSCVIEKSSDTTPLNRNPVGYSAKDSKNAVFKMITPVYYLKTANGINEVKDKGNVLDIFPDKVNELNAFFKSNKIKFNKEESLIKLVTFINSLT